MPTLPPESRIDVFRFALGVAAGTALFVIVASTRADVDLWGHLRFGLDMLEQRRLDRQDPYSFTSDRPWVNHEWLSELAFAAAWQAGGNAGLIGLKLACMLGALSVVALMLRRHRLPPASQALILSVSLLGILPRSTHVRPQLFSVLLFALLLYLCDRSERGSRKILLWTVPLLCAWANVHGGWVVGLATLGLWTVGLWWARRSEGPGAFLVMAFPVGAGLATLVNPYGVGLWEFLVATVRLGREGITEWGPIWTNVSRALLWALLAAAVVLVAARHRPRNPARLLIPVVWGAAAFRVNRLDAFFTLSVIILLMPSLTGMVPIFRTSPVKRLSRAARVAVIGGILLAAFALPGTRRALTCVEVTPSWWPEPEATRFVHSRRLAGRMVTFFNWGEYGIWHLPRSVKVSFDGRRETVYSDEIIAGHLELYAGTPRGLAFLESLNADYIWFPADLAVTRRLPLRGWTRIFEGPRSVIFERVDRMTNSDSRLAVADGHPPRCFPGP